MTGGGGEDGAGPADSWAGGKQTRRSGGLGPSVWKDGWSRGLLRQGRSWRRAMDVQGRLGQAEFEKPRRSRGGREGCSRGQAHGWVGPEAREPLGEG